MNYYFTLLRGCHSRRSHHGKKASERCKRLLQTNSCGTLTQESSKTGPWETATSCCDLAAVTRWPIADLDSSSCSEAIGGETHFCPGPCLFSRWHRKDVLTSWPRPSAGARPYWKNQPRGLAFPSWVLSATGFLTHRAATLTFLSRAAWECPPF